MAVIGCRPEGRHTEQHDVFFGIGESMKGLIPDMKRFWPEAKGNLHIDAWREVTAVDGYSISVADRSDGGGAEKDNQLFFINLGGYRQGLFDELHFKVLTVQRDKGVAVQQVKTTRFYQQASIPAPGGESHIDDKYGVDVDDIYEISDILPISQKDKYTLCISKAEGMADDELHIGYYKLSTLP